LNKETSKKQKFKTDVEVVWDTRIWPFNDQESYRLFGINMAEIHVVVTVAMSCLKENLFSNLGAGTYLLTPWSRVLLENLTGL
jgi:hypothetical protein